MDAVNYVDYSQVDEKTRVRMEELLKFPRSKYWKRKRAFDVAFSLTAIVLLLPIFVIISLLICIDSPKGGPIFKQTRVGRHGKEFKLYKFRTMVANAESMKQEIEHMNEMDGPVFKIKNDPRITRVGKILRATSLDELPQFFNVLKGDMSMVGPRPPIPSEVLEYTDYQRLRLIVTPGMTCEWQTADARNDISFEEWVDMDLDYIKHRNMFVDCKLIFRTVAVVFRRQGR